MRPQTKEIKQVLQKQLSVEEKILLLADSYKGEDCYILTAGPSIRDYPAEYLREKLKDKLVIAVKQTFNIIPDVVDFHLLNQYNYQTYQYGNNRPIIMMVEIEGMRAKTPRSNQDITLYIDGEKANKEDSLAIKLNYEDFLLNKTLQRPFGPGIMHEVGIYLPILLGVRSINVIGWDLGNKNNNGINRFYEQVSLQKMLQNVIMTMSPAVYNKLYIKIENKINYFRFLLGRNVVINNPGISIGEAEFISASTKELFIWLKKKNIELNIISDKSMVDEAVPRIKL